jgi:hypothetical protein
MLLSAQSTTGRNTTMNKVATELRRLGVKGVLIDAAEQGYITEAACGMERCYCPEGASHFVRNADGWSDWNPTHEHAPIAKRDGGHRTVENSILAHRFCNKIDYMISANLPVARDFKRMRASAGQWRTAKGG